MIVPSEYHELANSPSTVVDPCIRMSWVERRWNQDAIASAKADIREKVGGQSIIYDRVGLTHTQLEEYREKYPPDTIVPPLPTDLDQPRTFMTLGARYGLPDMAIQAEEQGVLPIDQEYNTYVTSTLTRVNTHPLAFWELERDRYPTIFRMAMDYLPVQPSSVPCERAFSSSSLTDTKQRNRIQPILMEALQVLKFSIKGERPLNLKSWMTSEQEMLHDEDGSQILATAIPGNPGHTQDLDTVLRAVEADEQGTMSNHVVIY